MQYEVVHNSKIIRRHTDAVGQITAVLTITEVVFFQILFLEGCSILMVVGDIDIYFLAGASLAGASSP